MVRAMSDDTRDGVADIEKNEQSRVMARRYFLRATIYAAPAVAAVVVVNHASAQVSCAACTTNHTYCTTHPLCGGSCGISPWPGGCP